MATRTTLARPYAKAAFGYAREQGTLADWDAMLRTAAAIAEDARVSALLGDPRIAREQLAELFAEVGGEHFSQPFANFLRLLAHNRRLGVLADIAALFARHRAEAERTLDVDVVSAVPLSEEQRRRLSEALAKRFGREVSLHCDTDAAVLGGFVVRAGDTVIDGSLRGKLQRMGERLYQ